MSSWPDLQPLLSLQQRSLPAGGIPALKHRQFRKANSELSPEIPRDDSELRWKEQEFGQWGGSRQESQSPCGGMSDLLVFVGRRHRPGTRQRCHQSSGWGSLSLPGIIRTVPEVLKGSTNGQGGEF